MSLGQVPQPPLDLGRRPIEPVPVDQDPGEPQVLAMAEDPALRMAGVERLDERGVAAWIGGRHAAWERRSIGSYVRGAGPTYSELGRMRRLSECCSMTCAAQPTTRLMAKMGVKRPVSIPR